MAKGLSSSLEKVNQTLDARPWSPIKEGNLLMQAKLLRQGLRRIIFEEGYPDYEQTRIMYDALRKQLPREFVRKKYPHGYAPDDNMLTAKEKKKLVAEMNGAIFEMQRINEMQSKPSVTVDLSLVDKIPVQYVGYDENASWQTIMKPMGSKYKARAPHKEINGQMELDVPIRLNRKPDVPYIYEVKDYRMDIWGEPFLRTVNQLLKYNSAVENKQTSGATVEVRGRISEKFIHWLFAKNDHLPNVEIVYSMPLPSGREYRFVLKHSKMSNNLGIESKWVDGATPEDLQVIKGIKSANKPGYRNLMSDTLTRFSVIDFPEEEELHDINPRKMDRFSNLVKYQYLINSKIWERFTDVALNGIPERYKRTY